MSMSSVDKTEVLTQQQAIALHESAFWVGMTEHDIAAFQLAAEKLCMPLDVFKDALEGALRRPVLIHELRDFDRLKRELSGEAAPATLAEVLALLPSGKRVILLRETVEDNTPG